MITQKDLFTKEERKNHILELKRKRAKFKIRKNRGFPIK